MSSNILGNTAELETVWPELISGRTRIVSSGTTQAHHYFQLAVGAQAPELPKLTATRLRIFERVLLGESQKVVAMELGCATSTVATAVGACLRAMGVTGGSSRVPPLLVLVLHALRGRVDRLEVRIERSLSALGKLQIVSSARLDSCLADKLTQGELAVISPLIEGQNHVEIARQRGTSIRTVANQIASAYKKLRVSGRMELLCYLVSRLDTSVERRVAHLMTGGERGQGGQLSARNP